MRFGLLALGFVFAMPVVAVPVTVQYTGVVTQLAFVECEAVSAQVCNYGAGAAMSSSDAMEGRRVSVGDAFSGSFTYEAGQLPSASSPDGYGAYYFNADPGAYFQSGELLFPRDAAAFPPSGVVNLSLTNDKPANAALHDSLYAYVGVSTEAWYANLEFLLQDQTGQVFNSFELPVSPELSAFTSSSLDITFVRLAEWDWDELRLTGALTSLSVSKASEVPEPGTWALLLVGLATVGGVTMRARRRGFKS